MGEHADDGDNRREDNIFTIFVSFYYHFFVPSINI